MKITEKLYIERLEKMIKKYPNDVCGHCPKMKYFMLSTNSTAMYKGMEFCNICVSLAEKYTDYTGSKALVCPCYYFEEIFENEDKAMPKDFMLKIAQKMIKGWRKDHLV